MTSSVSHCIARIEAERFENMTLGFFGAADKNLTRPDKGMGAGKISIERSRHVHIRRCLRGALVEYLDIS